MELSPETFTSVHLKELKFNCQSVHFCTQPNITPPITITSCQEKYQGKIVTIEIYSQNVNTYQF